MNASPSHIDLGLVAMPVGEARQQAAQPERIDMRIDDVARMEALMHQSPGAPAGQGGAGQRQSSASFNAPPPVEFIPGRLARLATALGQLWVSLGASSRREVSARLDPQLLANTWVRLFEDGGCLQGELRCMDSATRQWLAAELTRLAMQVGQRLDREVRFVLLGPASEEPLCSAGWKPGDGS